MKKKTDKDKIMALANLFEDKIYEKPLSVQIPAWKRRFVFNKAGEIIRVQDIVKSGYNTIGRA